MPASWTVSGAARRKQRRNEKKWTPLALWTNARIGLQWERAIAASTDVPEAFLSRRVPCVLDALVALWPTCTSCSDSPGKPAPVLRPEHASTQRADSALFPRVSPSFSVFSFSTPCYKFPSASRRLHPLPSISLRHTDSR